MKCEIAIFGHYKPEFYIRRKSDGMNVLVKFQYPSDTYKGEDVSLVFEITTTGGGKHTFYHHHVVVQ